MVQFDYHAAYFDAGDGWYTAQVLDFPGVVTQGRTLDKARKMLRSALRDMVEWRLEDGLPIPRPDSNASNPKATVSEPIKLVMLMKIESPHEASEAAATPSEARLPGGR